MGALKEEHDQRDVFGEITHLLPFDAPSRCSLVNGPWRNSSSTGLPRSSMRLMEAEDQMRACKSLPESGRL